MFDKAMFRKQVKIIEDVLSKAPSFEKDYRIPAEEFASRQKKVWEMLQKEGYECGIMYSNPFYRGDVPYLTGNTNMMVEPAAAILTKNGLYFIAGLEEGLLAEQYCRRSGVINRRVDIMYLESENYSKDVLRPEDIIREACGGTPRNIALLTSRSVFPVNMYRILTNLVGEENVKDLSEKYYEIKYNKSDNEMRLAEESCIISDVMLEGMLRTLQPGMTETQVAEWGEFIAREMGVESMGFPILVTSGINNKTMVGKAGNRIIREGDIVHVGVAPQRDGVSGAQRASVMCVRRPEDVRPDYKMWMDFLEDAFKHAISVYEEIAQKDLPGCFHEQEMIRYYDSRREELERRSGLSLPRFAELKAYATTHNSGYTECQELYGALNLTFNHKLPKQVLMMMDVGLCSYIDAWENEMIPNLDYIVIEKTTGKFDQEIRVLNRLPLNLQHLVGECF